MYFYCKKSKEKIIHLEDCFHISKKILNDIGYFESLNDAYKQGYRLCKHCNPMEKQYQKECDDILKICANKGLSVYSGDRYIAITSVSSKWKIALDKNNDMVLYHKNDFETPNDCMSPIVGYHLQGDVKKNSIISYLNYIIEHDYFRMVNPVAIPRKMVIPPPPKKGTKRYRKEQKKNAQLQKKYAVKNVLNLIDSLRIASV